MGIRTRRVVRGLGCVLLLPALALAQTEAGKIVGTVRDPSGAVLPGVAVTLVSVERATVRATVTDAAGVYVFAGLVPGGYEVAAELAGFVPRKIQATVPVGATVAVNLALALASQSETVTVTAELAPAVNLSTQDISTIVTGLQIQELPVITRNPYDLVGLSGNVVREDSGGTRGTGFVMNGLRSAGTNVLLDGGANNDEFTAAVGQDVPLDAVQEFSVITSNFSAQFGRASAGIVNVATKSGTNAFHGSAYEFFRSEDLATRTFDEKANGREQAPFERNVAGFSLGGPIRRDRLHFFVDAEYLRVRSTTVYRSYEPTAELLARTAPNTQAFFAAFPLKPGLQRGRVLTAGEIVGVAPGGPFSELPASLPVFQELAWDVPFDAGGGPPGDDIRLLARVDWAIGTQASAFVRYAFQDVELPDGSVSTSPYDGFDTPEVSQRHNLLGSLTYVFSPRWTAQTKVVYNRLAREDPLGERPFTPALAMGAMIDPDGQTQSWLPGYPSNIPFGGPQKLLQLYEDVNIVAGRHDVRFGGSFVRVMDDRTFAAGGNAIELLGNTTAGRSLDNLMRGYLLYFQGAVDPQDKYPGDVVRLPLGEPDFTRYNRYNEWALYANDAWRLSSRVTLNLGLRYEYFGVQHNTDPSLDSNFYYGTGANRCEQIRSGRVWPAPDSPVGGLWRPDWNNVAPRVGFAWDLTGDGKTSLRAGYGIGYERNFGNVTYNVVQNPPRYAMLSLRSDVDISQSLNLITTDNRGPMAGTGNVVLPRTSLRHVDEDIRTASAQFWNVSLQREVFPGSYAEVAYTGSKGSDLYSIADPNRPGSGPVYLGDPPGPGRLNTQYSLLNTRGNGGWSLYHGLTFGWDARRVGDTGLQFTGRYTLGFAKDNLSTTFSETWNAYNLGFLDPFAPSLDNGWSDRDVRHRLVTSGIWQVPVARDGTGLRRALLGDWSVTWLFLAQSGGPFTIYDCTNGFAACMRLLAVAPRAGYTVTPTGDPNSFVYLDFSNQAAGFGAYAHPLTGTSDFGPYPENMEARNTYRKPGRWNLDAMLAKEFRLGGSLSLQLRLEVYNVFNHANLYLIDWQTDTFYPRVTAYKGYVPDYFTSLAGDGQRRIQLGVRLEF